MYEKHVIIGNLGREPEMRYTPSGVPVTDCSVAVNRRYTRADGERVEKTTWYKVVAWRKLGETCAQYLTRGRAVLVEGDLAAEAYLDREGKPVAKLVLTATTVQFLGGRGNGDEAATAEAAALALPEDDATPATARGATFAATFEADDDLPF